MPIRLFTRRLWRTIIVTYSTVWSDVTHFHCLFITNLPSGPPDKWFRRALSLSLFFIIILPSYYLLKKVICWSQGCEPYNTDQSQNLTLISGGRFLFPSPISKVRSKLNETKIKNRKSIPFWYRVTFQNGCKNTVPIDAPARRIALSCIVSWDLHSNLPNPNKNTQKKREPDNFIRRNKI